MIKKLTLALITSLLIIAIPINSLADCAKPVIRLEQGEAAPCYGFLFSPEKETEMFKLNEDYKLLNLQLDKQRSIIDANQKQQDNLNAVITLEQQKGELWRSKAEDSTTKLMAADNGRGSRDMLFLGTGIVLTILTAWAYGQVNHK